MEQSNAERGPVSIFGVDKKQVVITTTYERRGLTSAAAETGRLAAIAGDFPYPAGVVDATMSRDGETEGYKFVYVVETRVQSDWP